MARQSLLRIHEVRYVFGDIITESMMNARQHLHRLELPNLFTLYPAAYLHTLLTWALATQPERPANVNNDAEEFSWTPIAAELAGLSESGLQTEIHNHAQEINGVDELTITTSGVTKLFGITRTTVKNWVERDRLLVPIESQENAFTLRSLASIYRWRRPEGMDSVD